jgi:hypothetical protein
MQLTDVPGNYQIFRNIGQLPDWGQEGWVFTQEWDRKRVRIADVDGDGKCDIIHLAENEVVEHWYKTHYENGQWRFEEEFGEIRGLHPCSQRDGVGLFDLAVRFADLKYFAFLSPLPCASRLRYLLVAMEKRTAW